MFLVIFSSLLGSLISLIGGIILISHKKFVQWTEFLTAFAGGSLLAAAFIDLLPEALHEGGDMNLVSGWTLFGLLLFFVFEAVLAAFCGKKCDHQHHRHLIEENVKVSMIVIGDTVHNFIDGVAIAAGFLISPLSGIIATIAVATHEIPQEIGEFALLFKKNIHRRKIVLINLVSSFAATIGAIIFYWLGKETNISLTPILGLVAGFFIYLAISDIIPMINSENDNLKRIKKTLILIIGVLIAAWLINFLQSWASI